MQITIFLFLSIFIFSTALSAQEINRTPLATFDFIGNDTLKGFPPYRFSDIGENPCGVYNGHTTSKLCSPTSEKIYLYYNYSNNNHLGWLRYGAFSADNQNSVKGSSFKVEITGGAHPGIDGSVQYDGLPVFSHTQIDQYLDNKQYPYGSTEMSRQTSIYFKTSSATTPFPALQGKNRLSVWAYTPTNKDKLNEYSTEFVKAGRPNINFALYTFLDTSRGGHYYHSASNIPLGNWTHYVFDAHPTHHNAGVASVTGDFREGGTHSPGNGIDYFNRIVTYSLVVGTESGPLPYAFYIDEIESYRKNYENEETIVNMGVGYSSEKKLFDISFGDKYRCLQCYANYQVRYSFSPIDNSNFEQGFIPEQTINFNRSHTNTEGSIIKSSPGYNEIWAALKLRQEHEDNLSIGTKIYFAVRDMSKRTQIKQDSYDLELVNVPGVGPKRRMDLVKSIDYEIHAISVNPTIELSVPNSIFANLETYIDVEIVGSKEQYSYDLHAHPSLKAMITDDAKVKLTPEAQGEHTITLVATSEDKQEIVRSFTVNVIPQDCRVIEECNQATLVDFNKSRAESVFGISSWDDIITDRYTGFYKNGTSIVVGSNPGYDYQGVRGPKRYFTSGDVITATFTNYGTNEISFTPVVTFNDPDRRGSGEPGEWMHMSSIRLKAGETSDSYYVLDDSHADSYGLVSISVNKSNSKQIVVDKIVLSTAENVECGNCTPSPILIEQPSNTAENNCPITSDNCPEILIVDFNSADVNQLSDLNGWQEIIKDRYTGFHKEGTSIVIGQNGGYDYQGIRGTLRSFLPGQSIKAYIVNHGEKTITFSPRISLNDDDRQFLGTIGQWHNMSEVSIPPGGRKAAVFAIDQSTAGSFDLVNLSINFNNHKTLIVDSIYLVSPDIVINGPNNCLILEKCHKNLLVDFEQNTQQSLFGIEGWKGIIRDVYTGFYNEGTSIVIGRNGSYDFQGVTGSLREYKPGEVIVADYINTGSTTRKFTPFISFIDNGRRSYNSKSWHPMSEIELPPGATGTASFQFDTASTGSYQVVNISSNVDNNKTIILDKIHLYTTEAEVCNSCDIFEQPTESCLTNQACQSIVLVDFNKNKDESIFELSGWNKIIKDVYTHFYNIGTSISIGSNGGYDYQGIQGTTHHFNAGDVISVRIKNDSNRPVTLTPQYSLNDPDRKWFGQHGTWSDMAEIKIQPHSFQNTYVVIDKNNEGEHDLFNISINHDNHKQIIVDKITLLTSQ